MSVSPTTRLLNSMRDACRRRGNGWKLTKLPDGQYVIEVSLSTGYYSWAGEPEAVAVEAMAALVKLGGHQGQAGGPFGNQHWRRRTRVRTDSPTGAGREDPHGS